MTIDLRSEIVQLHAQVCRGLADSNRIMILYALKDTSCNVNDLVKLVGLPQPTISRHLKTLRESQMVTARREGQSVYYELADPRIIQALDLLRAVMADRIADRANLMNHL